MIAPRWKLVGTKIRIELKDEIRKRIGRSPDRGDAVALTCMADNNLVLHAQRTGLMGRPAAGLPTTAKTGYSGFKSAMRGFRGRR